MIRRRLTQPFKFSDAEAAVVWHGVNGWEAAAAKYGEMCKQNGQDAVDDEILKNCPHVDVGFLLNLKAINEGRLNPELLLVDIPIYVRAIGITKNEQDFLVSAETLLAPIKTKKGKIIETEILPVPKVEIKAWQAKIIIRGGKLDQNRESVKKAAFEP